MGRLLRLVLYAVARGLRAVASRIDPQPIATVVVNEEPTTIDIADGPPDYWLAMVRTRAPGLHLSMQERGVVARRAAPVARAVPVMPPLSSIPEPQQTESPAWGYPALELAAAAQARPALARSLPTPRIAVPSPSFDDLQPDLEPHTWDASAKDEEQEWTRAPTRRRMAFDSTTTLRPSLSPADATVARAWSPASVADVVEPHSARQPSTTSHRQATRPDLHPVPTALARESDRHSAATPVFAPSRDEDAVMRRATPPRRSYPTPSPTHWDSEALQSLVDEAISLFPPLTDEASRSSAAVHASSVVPAHQALPRQRLSSDPRCTLSGAVRASSRDELDSGDSWPALPYERTPALRLSSVAESMPSRWPELMDDINQERDDEGLALPDGHRERLAREHLGQLWNG